MRRAAIWLVLCCALVAPGPAQAWGDKVHRLVSERAAALLPDEMGFLREHALLLGEWSVAPDTVKRTDPDERIRHYLDIDLLSSPPFKDVPHRWDAVVAKYGLETALDAGRLPWAIEAWVWRLAGAMRAGDGALVLREAGWLSHYGADLMVPLHATKNYDGQLTGNKGVHKRFEVTMVDPNLAKMVFYETEPVVLEDPLGFAFGELAVGWTGVQTILDADTEAARFDPTYGNPYYAVMWQRAGELARQRIERAIWAVASLWLTAWHRAGEPPLDDLWTTP